tara:strand:- start:355 stop:1746 length:1392 start_codon:yes stop_codon:yes gene_type:complete
MAEILTQTMHRFSTDVATSNGNIVIGTADATDSNTQGVSKSAEHDGIFVYTDKSFQVFICYTDVWEEYTDIDATDEDWTNSTTIPWLDHPTHGAPTAMYFKTTEADHIIRLVHQDGAMFIDRNPGDGDFETDALITGAATPDVDGNLYGADNLIFKVSTLDASTVSPGETITDVISGKVIDAYIFADKETLDATISYNGETFQTTIEYTIPGDATANTVYEISYEYEYVNIPSITAGAVVWYDFLDSNCYPGAPTGDPTIDTYYKVAHNLGSIQGINAHIPHTWAVANNHMACGGTSSIFTPTGDSIEVSTGMTYELWCKGNTSQFGLIETENAANAGMVSGVQIHLYQTPEGNVYVRGSALSPAYDTGDIYNATEGWMHLVVIFEGNDTGTSAGKENCIVYKNGVLHGNGDVQNVIPGHHTKLGDPYSLTDDFCDIWRVYHKVLTQPEIQKNFDHEKSRFGL